MTIFHSKPKIQWLTTKPSGRAHTHGADAGQTGWRLHAVEADDKDSIISCYYKAALCGLRPRHGWSLDLFIDEPCKRCLKKAGAPPVL